MDKQLYCFRAQSSEVSKGPAELVAYSHLSVITKSV